MVLCSECCVVLLWWLKKCSLCRQEVTLRDAMHLETTPTKSVAADKAEERRLFGFRKVYVREEDPSASKVPCNFNSPRWRRLRSFRSPP